VCDGKVFIPSKDWRMWAFDLATGEELWRTAELHNGMLQNHSYCSPAAAGGAIYYQSLNGTFYVINETDGSVLWSFPLGGYGFGSPSIGDGCVFITNDFALYAFRIGLGSGDWPMFCHNGFHQSFSEQGVEYVRWPLTQPKIFKDSSSVWAEAKFVWCNETIASAAVAWRVYFSDGEGNENATDVMVFYVNMPVHNIAVVGVVPEQAVIEQNQTLAINVTVVNEGNYTETFNVTLYYDSMRVGFQATVMNSGESRVLTFEWNTTGVSIGNYTISAWADTVPEEAYTQDNLYILEYYVTVIPEFPLAIALLVVFIVSTSTVAVLVRRRLPASRLLSA